MGVRYKVHGNNLHILCESHPCPQRSLLVARLLLALQQTDVNALRSPEHPPIYQILLYARERGQKRPEWTVPIFPNQIDRHLEQLRKWGDLDLLEASGLMAREAVTDAGDDQGSSGGTATLETTAPSEGTIVLTNRGLARRGDPDGIARYLSETLSRLGISVLVRAKALPCAVRPGSLLTSLPLLAEQEGITEPPEQRLWITCESSYSPTPALVGQPIARQLRELDLEGFRDAVIRVQVKGEPDPDWVLRIDLTPRQEMLREWARWGDVEAIACLLRQDLTDHAIQLSTASLQSATLHLFFAADARHRPSESDTPAIPERELVLNIVEPLLETLGPQGIHGATLYGQGAEEEPPAWVEWRDLPAAKHLALADAPMTLARQGDWGAIAFLLARLLNSNLEEYLETGGIQLQLLPKGELLHVMADGPTCPARKRVGRAVAQFFKQLHLSQVLGVRVYGRRAGQKQPQWSYGVDFQSRPRLVPEAMPEFAATDAYVKDLVAQSEAEILRSDLTPSDIQGVWANLRQTLLQRSQQLLVGSQCFMPLDDSQELPSLPAARGRYRNVAIALIWGAVGTLLAIQADWGLGRFLETAPDEEILPLMAMQPGAIAELSFPGGSIEFGESRVDYSSSGDWGNLSEFTQPDQAAGGFSDESEPGWNGAVSTLPYVPRSPNTIALTAAILADDPGFSTFNSRQLDEKIQIYHRYLEEYGPPDVLIVGSSRALRGIDPLALEDALADLGYEDVRVFNFGINGATAQVVDLVVRRLIPPDQLPGLIIWADGARAFNSGTVDVTYNGISESEGFRDLVQGKLPLLTATDVQPASSAAAEPADPAPLTDGVAASLSASYQDIDYWLSDQLGQLSTLYDQRDRLKQQVQTWLTTPLPEAPPLQPPTLEEPATAEDVTDADAPVAAASPSILVPGDDIMDLNGFLPLAVQFNPATYYQRYARVMGQYDSDYENFSIAGKQEDSMQIFLEFTRSRNIPVVFVNLPLTEEYLDPVRLQYEQVFQQYMLDIALSQGGLMFRDLSGAWITEYNYFSDPSHLNRYGAYQVAQRLAQDPMMPWGMVQETASANAGRSERVRTVE
jgi:hypothetical protein